MPRQRIHRPTEIYWLVDIRPDTIAAGWSTGKPFYCGKTTRGLGVRLGGHYSDARRRHTRPVSSAVLACGKFIRVDLMEHVISEGPWEECEQDWIATLRWLNPDCVNVSDGGQGMLGYIASQETLLRRSKSLTGKKRSPEAIERMRIARTGKTHGPDARRKLSEFNKGKIVSEETRQKMRENAKGRKHTPEARAKMSASASLRVRTPLSEDTKRKIGEANKGHVHSPEFGQRIRERQKGRKQTAEQIAKRAESNRGRKRSPESCMRIRDAVYAANARKRARLTLPSN